MAPFRDLRGLALVAAVAVLATACGQLATAPTPTPSLTPTPSPTPPTFSVVRTTPPNGATEVGLGTNIVVEFSAPVDNAPLSGGNPCVAGIVIAPAPVSGPAACAVVGNAVTWSGLVLRGTTTYTVTVPAQVRSVAEVPLGTSFSWTFTTRTGQLTNAVLPMVRGSQGRACAPGNGGPGVGPGLWVGDDEGGILPPFPLCTPGADPIPRFRAFVAFALPAQMLTPPAAVQNATLTVSVAEVVGDFFDVLLGGGPVRLVRVDYLDNGALDQADYAMGPVGQLLDVFDSTNFMAPASVDVTGMVQNAVLAPPTSVPGQQPYVGFRFQWGTASGLVENTNNNGLTEAVRLGEPVLQVTFWH